MRIIVLVLSLLSFDLFAESCPSFEEINKLKLKCSYTLLDHLSQESVEYTEDSMMEFGGDSYFAYNNFISHFKGFRFRSNLDFQFIQLHGSKLKMNYNIEGSIRKDNEIVEILTPVKFRSGICDSFQIEVLYREVAMSLTVDCSLLK